PSLNVTRPTYREGGRVTRERDARGRVVSAEVDLPDRVPPDVLAAVRPDPVELGVVLREEPRRHRLAVPRVDRAREVRQLVVLPEIGRASCRERVVMRAAVGR